MSRKNSLLAPLFACSLLLVMGALNHEPIFLSQSATPPFIAQPVSLDAQFQRLSAAELLASALARLTPDSLRWLSVTMWQKQTDDEVSFEAQGRLVRGPNGCARQEMTIRTGEKVSSVVTVSDGVSLAITRKLACGVAELDTMKLTNADNTTMSVDQIGAILGKHGCGGPLCLLRNLADNLENWQLEVGTWKKAPVIRLTATLKDVARGPADSRFAVRSRDLPTLFGRADSLAPPRGMVGCWSSRGGRRAFSASRVS